MWNNPVNLGYFGNSNFNRFHINHETKSHSQLGCRCGVCQMMYLCLCQLSQGCEERTRSSGISHCNGEMPAAKLSLCHLVLSNSILPRSNAEEHWFSNCQKHCTKLWNLGLSGRSAARPNPDLLLLECPAERHPLWCTEFEVPKMKHSVHCLLQGCFHPCWPCWHCSWHSVNVFAAVDPLHPWIIWIWITDWGTQKKWSLQIYQVESSNYGIPTLFNLFNRNHVMYIMYYR